MYLDNLEDRGFKVFLRFYTGSILHLVWEIIFILNMYLSDLVLSVSTVEKKV